MKILRTKDPEAIKLIVPMIEAYIEDEGVSYTFEGFIRSFRSSILNPYTIVLIAEDDEKEVIGYAIAYVSSEYDREFVTISQLYSKPGQSAEIPLIERLEKYAIDNGIRHLSISVNNGLPKADEMGFKLDTIFFMKDVSKAGEGNG